MTNKEEISELAEAIKAVDNLTMNLLLSGLGKNIVAAALLEIGILTYLSFMKKDKIKELKLYHNCTEEFIYQQSYFGYTKYELQSLMLDPKFAGKIYFDFRVDQKYYLMIK